MPRADARARGGVQACQRYVTSSNHDSQSSLFSELDFFSILDRVSRQILTYKQMPSAEAKGINTVRRTLGMMESQLIPTVQQ